MAFPTSVNNQITDSITQGNVEMIGNAPAVALNNLTIATSQALANAAHNAAAAQQQMNAAWQAATVQAVSTLLNINTAAAEKATDHIFQ